MDSIPPILQPTVEVPPILASSDSQRLPPSRGNRTEGPRSLSQRWARRGLFLVCGLALIGSVVLATSDKPRLGARSERVPLIHEQTIQFVVNNVDQEMDHAIALAIETGNFFCKYVYQPTSPWSRLPFFDFVLTHGPSRPLPT